MIASAILLIIALMAYSVFMTRRAMSLMKSLEQAEVLLTEENNIAIGSLHVLNRVHNTIDTVSKYPVAENDPHIQLIVKNIASARDELKQFTSRYTIEENV